VRVAEPQTPPRCGIPDLSSSPTRRRGCPREAASENPRRCRGLAGWKRLAALGGPVWTLVGLVSLLVRSGSRFFLWSSGDRPLVWVRGFGGWSSCWRLFWLLARLRLRRGLRLRLRAAVGVVSGAALAKAAGAEGEWLTPGWNRFESSGDVRRSGGPGRRRAGRAGRCCWMGMALRGKNEPGCVSWAGTGVRRRSAASTSRGWVGLPTQLAPGGNGSAQFVACVDTGGRRSENRVVQVVGPRSTGWGWCSCGLGLFWAGVRCLGGRGNGGCEAALANAAGAGGSGSALSGRGGAWGLNTGTRRGRVLRSCAGQRSWCRAEMAQLRLGGGLLRG